MQQGPFMHYCFSGLKLSCCHKHVAQARSVFNSDPSHAACSVFMRTVTEPLLFRSDLLGWHVIGRCTALEGLSCSYNFVMIMKDVIEACAVSRVSYLT
jgi:hypothetical protein